MKATKMLHSTVIAEVQWVTERKILIWPVGISNIMRHFVLLNWISVSWSEEHDVAQLMIRYISYSLDTINNETILTESFCQIERNLSFS